MPHIVIRPDGVVRFIYMDELLALCRQGQAQVQRASHVEPTVDGQWGADLSPVGGPVLGPFETRSEALAAEVSWLENNRLI